VTLALAGALVSPVLTATPAGASGTIVVDTTADLALSPPSATVCPVGSCSLRAALAVADNLGDNETVQLQSSVTYDLTLGPLVAGTVSGQALTVQGSNDTIDQQTATSAVFSLDPSFVGGVTVAIDDVTIENGSDDTVGGAGIQAGDTGDVLSLSGDTFSDNVVGGSATNTPGGAIQMIGGDLSVTNCTFTNNSAGDSNGGAIDFEEISPNPGTLTVTGSTFTSNTSADSLGGGGAISVASGGTASTFTISGSTFSSNTASNGSGVADGGGAILDQNGTLTLTSDDFTSNQASSGSAHGGALNVVAGTASVTASRFVGNTAAAGGQTVSAAPGATVTAAENWWGQNTGPAASDTSGFTAPTTWVVMAFNTTRTDFLSSQTASLTTDLAHDNMDNAVTGVPDGTPVSFATNQPGGVLTVTSTTTASGTATSQFTAAADDGPWQLSSTVDNQTLTIDITVGVGPGITGNPSDQTVTAGNTATFTAAASGSPVPTVQWQVSTDGGATFSNVSGATSTTLAFSTTGPENGNEYRAVFTNVFGTATTTAATLTVDTGPVVSLSPSSQTVTAGNTATFTAAATGVPAPTVQWQVSTDGGATFNNIPGATSTTLAFSTNFSENGNKYRAVFTNSVGSATTATATLTVDTGPVVTTNPSSQTVTAGNTVTFTAAASGNPAPTVQWQVSTDGGATFNNVPGATSTTLAFTTSQAESGNEYQAVFTNSVGGATTSAATLTVQTGPVVSQSPSSQTVTAGNTATFTAAATGVPAPTVQWQVSTDGGATFNNIPGATSTTLAFTTSQAESGNKYRAVFTNAAGSATTATATLTVQTAPVVTQSPSDQTVTAGNTATFTAAASGVPAPTVQWQVSTDGGATFNNVPGATSTTLAFSTTFAENGNEYQAVFTNGAGSATTATATLTVQTQPVVTTSPVSQTVLAGTTATFTAAASGNPVPTVQWQVSTDGGATFGDVPGATSTTLSFVASQAESGDLYQAVFTNVVGGATTARATLTVHTPPSITSADTVSTVVDVPFTFEVTSTGVPTAALTETGGLPTGVAFTDNGNGTASLSGTPGAGTSGTYVLTIGASNGAGSPATQTFVLVVQSPGFWMVGGDGGVFAVGGATYEGSLPGLDLHLSDIVGIAGTPDGKGYWLVGKDGGVFRFGDAPYEGSLPGLGVSLDDIVGIAGTPDGKGYWLVGKDGGVFPFGDARYEGSLPGLDLSVSDIVGIVSTPDGKGYWLVGGDGGVFNLGDAFYYGSMGGTALAAPVVGIASTVDGAGYWLAAADGGVFPEGDAAFAGALAGTPGHAAVVGIAATQDGRGYWLSEVDGSVANYGDAAPVPSLPTTPVLPIVGSAEA